MRRIIKGIANVVGVLIGLYLIAEFTYFNRHSIREVESAITNANIIGQSPDSVIARLERVKLSWNDELDVSFYFHNDRSIQVSANSPGNKFDMGWRVTADIKFDEHDLARSFKALNSAISPF